MEFVLNVAHLLNKQNRLFVYGGKGVFGTWGKVVSSLAGDFTINSGRLLEFSLFSERWLSICCTYVEGFLSGGHENQKSPHRFPSGASQAL